jgi:hypothetical protein
MLEIDRWALARAAELQAEILAHYEVYEFHPVVAKLQVFCSEDLGAFYLDVLKDRLYTTAPKSLARRSAQTALWQITHAMLRWMAPFLSFTAEEAWAGVRRPRPWLDLHRDLLALPRPMRRCWPSGRASAPSATRVNKEIEAVRVAGGVGSSLQATWKSPPAPTMRAARAPGRRPEVRHHHLAVAVVAGRRTGRHGDAVDRQEVRALLALARRRRQPTPRTRRSALAARATWPQAAGPSDGVAALAARGDAPLPL